MSARIPENDTDFNNYLTTTTNYLQLTPGGGKANWDRLNLTAAENTQWQDFNTAWATAWAKVVQNNAQNIRNSNDIKAKNDARQAFANWAIDPAMNKLNRIAASPEITDQDRSIFNLKLRDDTPTPRPQITTAPFVDFKGEDGAMVQITCRVAHDASRASLHPDADVIEMKYTLLQPTDAAPANPEELPGTSTSTKAIFRFEAGMANAGKRLFAYLRWRNNTEPEKSGPWNQVMTIIISD